MLTVHFHNLRNSSATMPIKALKSSNIRPNMSPAPNMVNNKSTTIPALLPRLLGIQSDSNRYTLDCFWIGYLPFDDEAISRRMDPYHFR